MLLSDCFVALPSGGALHCAGPAGAEGLLFLHGVGGGAWSWQAQREALGTHLRIFTWEARGHGAAARVRDAGLADYYVDALEALAEARAQTSGPVHVAGHSMGGLLAMSLACERPDDVRSLFLVDTVYATEEAGGHLPPALAGIAAFACGPAIRSIANDGWLARRLMRWMFACSFEDRERMEAAWPAQRAQVPLEYPRMLREGFSGPTGFAVRDFAREIGAPTYILEGSAHGGARFPALIAGLRASLGDRFMHESIAGGHYLQLDRPSEVSTRLAAFVGAHAHGASARASS